jgi:site-specific DNA recombinase
LHRFVRNMDDQTELTGKFNNLGIRLLSVTENNDNNSSGRFMRNITGAFNQYENEVRGEATVGGMKEAVKEGHWCWKAPIGYRNARDINQKAILLPTEDSPYIVEAFRLAVSGLYSQVLIVDELRRKGFKRATVSLVNRILRNPLYAGLIKTSWLDSYVDGVHKPLISRDVYFNVQQTLNGNRPRIVPKVRNHPDFPLRNFIRCPKCGQKMTGGWSTGSKKVKYAYYHCRTKGCSLNAKKEDTETRFVEHLRSLEPKKDILALFRAIALDVWNRSNTERVNDTKRLEAELLSLEKERDKVEDLKIKDVFDDITYRRRSAEIRSQMDQKRTELDEENTKLSDNIEGCLQYCEYFISNLAGLWTNAGLDLKQRVQTLVFPDKIYFDGQTFRTAVTALIFKQLQQIQAPESQVVAPWGFEPQSLG